MSSDTYTCDNCDKTFESDWSDEEAAAEAEGNFPGIDVRNPHEAGLVCDDCYQQIMARVRAEAPELIGPGWREETVLREAAELGIAQSELDREMADMFSTPPGYVPGVGFVSGLAMRMLSESTLFPWMNPDSKCYSIGAGMVHVQPGCRCRPVRR